ncbi:hypothetical protein F5X99DRAFT_391332 [Biscogniauxia marginata]|nr:hypothetical protein F5X99DRAFT_391332 [Biscogniauxia marginata]
MADHSNNGKVYVNDAPAVVSWLSQDGQVRYLHDAKAKSAVTFELYHDASSRTAFFKLRASVSLKDLSKPKTRVFLYIHPERIHSLTFSQDDSPASSLLDTTTICLRFALARAAALIVPQVSLAAANSGSGQILDALRGLASATSFTVHFPSAAVPRPSLLSVCALASQHRLTTMAKHADITGLYNGKGGMVWFADNATVTDTTSPEPVLPSYDDVVPNSQSSPSAPKGSGPSRKRLRTASVVEGREPGVTIDCLSNRGIHHDDPGVYQRKLVCLEEVEQVVESSGSKVGCARTMQSQFDELRSRMEKTEQVIVELKNGVLGALKIWSTLPALQTRLEQAEQTAKDLEGELAEVRDTVADREDLVDCQMDERFDAIKWGLETKISDYVEEHVKEAMPQLVRDYLGNASVSFKINHTC